MLGKISLHWQTMLYAADVSLSVTCHFVTQNCARDLKATIVQHMYVFLYKYLKCANFRLENAI